MTSMFRLTQLDMILFNKMASTVLAKLVDMGHKITCIF